MSIVQLRDVSIAFGAQKVAEGISMSVGENERIGLIGANGTGKTTLLRLIAGALEPDSGRIATKRGLRVGFLEQEPNLPADANVHDAALSAFADVLAVEARMRGVEHEIAHASETERGRLLKELGDLQARFEHAGGYEHESRTAAVLTGLGFPEEYFRRPVSVLSGGERSRLALARLLLRQADLLLLDEPTNHLDLEGIEWLERFLGQGYRGAALVVSHDRVFLDKTVTRILEIEDAQVATYPGNYSTYVGLKEERRLVQQRAYEKQQAFIRKEEGFYRRYHAAQRGREAKGRMKRLERLERMEAPRRRKEISVRFSRERDSTELCVGVEDLRKRHGEQTLFSGLSIEIYRGERVGVIGPNGSGKTTLLKTLLGEVKPDAGAVTFGRRTTTGYLPQVVEDTHSDRTALDEVWERRRTLDEVEVRNVLGRFLFSGDDAVLKRLSELSGGERKRVSLACLMVERANLLLLDEPTNHLDIPSRVALERALAGYDGTVIAVSHDRYFLNLIVDRLIVVAGEDTRVVHGTYEDYVRMKGEASAGASRGPEMKRPAGGDKRKGAAGMRRRKVSKNKLAKVEEEICRLEAEKEKLERALCEPAHYSEAGHAPDVARRYKEASEKLKALYSEWADGA